MNVFMQCNICTEPRIYVTRQAKVAGGAKAPYIASACTCKITQTMTEQHHLTVALTVSHYFTDKCILKPQL